MYGAVLGWKITDKIAARMEQMCGIRILHPRCMFCAKKMRSVEPGIFFCTQLVTSRRGVAFMCRPPRVVREG